MYEYYPACTTGRAAGVDDDDDGIATPADHGRSRARGATPSVYLSVRLSLSIMLLPFPD